MFCSVFPSGSDETIVRLKRSSGVILAIFRRFCKIEKARIGAISWADIGSVSPPQSILKKLVQWHQWQVNRDFIPETHANKISQFATISFLVP